MSMTKIPSFPALVLYNFSVTEPKTSSSKNKKTLTAALAFSGVAGLAVVYSVLRTPSETSSAVLFDYSAARLMAASAILAITVTLLVLAGGAMRGSAWWQRLAGKAAVLLAHQGALFALIVLLFTAFLSIVAVLALSLSSAANQLVILKKILELLDTSLIWIEFLFLLAGLLIFKYSQPVGGWQSFWTPLRLAVIFLIITAVYTIALKTFMTLTWDIRMRRLEEYIFLPAVIFLIWGFLQHAYRERAWFPAAQRVLLLIGIGVVTYAIYRHTAQWMEWQHTPSKAYWHELADAFLRGRLYLTNPTDTHDLTFYNGQWYVPNPPLPALVLMPFVALFGAAHINMVLFSIVLGSINAMLIFLILDHASRLELIPTGLRANLWLTGLAVLGTSHGWLAIMGRMWFISQLLTLGFAALAVLVVLRRRSPWLAGLCLGLAVMSRPNVFTLWPFLAGLALVLYPKEAGRIPWKSFLAWAVQSAVPVVAAVATLLGYNYIRFDNFFDFGYVTIHTAEWLSDAVRTYGMFNPHFIPANLYAMFIKLPILEMRDGCLYYSPTHEGISMLAMTPALIYIFRRWKINLWTISAGLSIVLSLGLLVLYHNTGAWQLGYRYLMDFLLPVLLLLAIAVGKRPGWLFRVLVGISVAGNLAGILWWFGKGWC